MNDTIEIAAKEMTSSKIISLERVGDFKIKVLLEDSSYLMFEAETYHANLEVYHIVPVIAKVEVNNDKSN